MSELRQRAENYLAMRRALGHKLSDRGRLLMSFVDFIEQASADHVSVELALAWATLPQGVQPVWWSQRLGVVRGFARDLAAIDERTEVPPSDALAAQTSRTPPHIYSSTEITMLMAEAKKMALVTFPGVP